jgi:hypothetical protein
MTKNLLALLSISVLAFSAGLASAPAAFAQDKMSKEAGGGRLSLESAHQIGQFPLKVVADKHHGATGDIDVVTTPRHLNR